MKSTRRQFVKNSLSLIAVVSINIYAIQTFSEYNITKHKIDESDRPPLGEMTIDHGVKSYVNPNGFISQASVHELQQIQLQIPRDLILI